MIGALRKTVPADFVFYLLLFMLFMLFMLFLLFIGVRLINILWRLRMILYQYDHCPYCVRVRMMIGRKYKACKIITLPYDDIDTPEKLIGKKMLPILIKDDGVAMPESMDILKYLDTYDNNPIMRETRLPNTFKEKLSELRVVMSKLCKPRLIKIAIDDFSTQGAVDYYMSKFTSRIGISFSEALQDTPNLIEVAQPIINWFDQHINKIHVTDGTFSLADLTLFPSLRNLTVVGELVFGDNINNYINYQCQQAGLESYSGLFMQQ